MVSPDAGTHLPLTAILGVRLVTSIAFSCSCAPLKPFSSGKSIGPDSSEPDPNTGEPNTGAVAASSSFPLEQGVVLVFLLFGGVKERKRVEQPAAQAARLLVHEDCCRQEGASSPKLLTGCGHLLVPSLVLSLASGGVSDRSRLLSVRVVSICSPV